MTWSTLLPLFILHGLAITGWLMFFLSVMLRNGCSS